MAASYYYCVRVVINDDGLVHNVTFEHPEEGPIFPERLVFDHDTEQWRASTDEEARVAGDTLDQLQIACDRWPKPSGGSVVERVVDVSASVHSVGATGGEVPEGQDSLARFKPTPDSPEMMLRLLACVRDMCDAMEALCVSEDLGTESEEMLSRWGMRGRNLIGHTPAGFNLEAHERKLNGRG